jgi:hypothetical protein
MEDFLLNTLGTWLIGFFQNSPGFASLLVFLGFIRLCIKPAMTILQAYVKWTPYDHDDKWLANMENSKGYKLLLYLLDWLLSVKVPTKK